MLDRFRTHLSSWCKKRGHTEPSSPSNKVWEMWCYCFHICTESYSAPVIGSTKIHICWSTLTPSLPSIKATLLRYQINSAFKTDEDIWLALALIKQRVVTLAVNSPCFSDIATGSRSAFSAVHSEPESGHKQDVSAFQLCNSSRSQDSVEWITAINHQLVQQRKKDGSEVCLL